MSLKHTINLLDANERLLTRTTPKAPQFEVAYLEGLIVTLQEAREDYIADSDNEFYKQQLCNAAEDVEDYIIKVLYILKDIE